jgi:hypothetical protein
VAELSFRGAPRQHASLLQQLQKLPEHAFTHHFIMLSPLDALSLAGTIIWFVDFSSKVLSQTRQLYVSQAGALPVNQELELVTSDLFALSQKLPDVELESPETQEGKALRKLAVSCSEIAVELSTKLNGLKVDAKHKSGIASAKLLNLHGLRMKGTT